MDTMLEQKQKEKNTMTEFDREFFRELRDDFRRDLYRTMDDEHRRGLNTNPYYGWTEREIINHEASLNVDPEPSQTEDEE